MDSDLGRKVLSLASEAQGISSSQGPFPLEGLQKLSLELGQDVCRDWTDLCSIVGRHEAFIWRRWTKKSVTRRKEILKGVWPAIPLSHRSDFDLHYKNFNRKVDLMLQNQNDSSVMKGIEAFIWPYINLEDLSTSRHLPLFLHARARNPPCIFAVHETFFSVQFRVEPKTVNPREPLALMHFANEDGQPFEYGQITIYENRHDFLIP